VRKKLDFIKNERILLKDVSRRALGLKLEDSEETKARREMATKMLVELSFELIEF